MVYENLRQTIVRGSIAPGTRLVESQISAAQGISRSPVREHIMRGQKIVLNAFASNGLR